VTEPRTVRVGKEVAVPVRISLFTSNRKWWLHGSPPEPSYSVEDIFPREAQFTSGRATLLSSGDGFVTGIARGGRRGGASDFDSNVSFDNIAEIQPIPLIDLMNAVRARARPTADLVFGSGFGLLLESASEDIRTWLETHHPEASTHLEGILVKEPDWLASSEMAGEYRMQRDAVNVALEIAGFDRTQALFGQLHPLQPKNFSLIPMSGVPEDSLVISDLGIFPGWEPLADLNPAGKVFEDPGTGRRLVCLHANKNKIEQTSGVDLVYYIHEYEAFVLVQYKRLRREGKQLVLRLNNQLDDEEARMIQVESSYAKAVVPPSSLTGRRLAEATCFFKLCDADQPGVVTDLARGKYVDLATWTLMSDLQLMVGPRGGRSLRYEAVTRYLTNSSFAELVSEGWVGSSSSQNDQLIEYLFERYEQGKSLLINSLNLGDSFRRPRRDAQRLRIRPVGSLI